jgi:hypothetical protein
MVAARVAAVAALLLSAICGSVHGARATDNCLGAPEGAAPNGQHWYYRIDRAQHRKCWYVHSTGSLPEAAAQTVPAKPAEQRRSVAVREATHATFAPPPERTSNAPSEGAGTERSPHVTVIAVKTVPMLLADATSAGHEPAPPQISVDNANALSQDEPTPANAEHPNSVPATSEPLPKAVATVETGATSLAQRLWQLFSVLALAVGVAAVLSTLLRNILRPARTPQCSDHPTDVFRRYSPLLLGDEEFAQGADAELQMRCRPLESGRATVAARWL